MNETTEPVPSALPAPTAPPPAPESRFLRIVRRAMIFSVSSFFLCIIFIFILERFRWLQMWMLVLMMISVGVALVSGLLRLGHALWVSARYAMSELLLTFFSASLVSMLLIQWLQSGREKGYDSDRSGGIIAIVVVTFAVFLAGSAWVWDVFRRAPALELNRYIGLFCGWLSAVGLLCFAGFLLMSLICALAGERLSGELLKWFLSFLFGSFLAIPGILIERAARRSTKLSQ